MYSNLKYLFNYLTYKIILLFNHLSIWVLFQNAGVFSLLFLNLPWDQQCRSPWRGGTASSLTEMCRDILLAQTIHHGRMAQTPADQQATGDRKSKTKIPSKSRSKHTKGSKECYLLRQKHNLQIFRVIPFIRLQNDT